MESVAVDFETVPGSVVLSVEHFAGLCRWATKYHEAVRAAKPKVSAADTEPVSLATWGRFSDLYYREGVRFITDFNLWATSILRRPVTKGIAEFLTESEVLVLIRDIEDYVLSKHAA